MSQPEISNYPAVKNLRLYPGTVINLKLVLKNKTTGQPYDLTGCTAGVRIIGSDGIIIHNDTSNESILIDPLTGQITIPLTAGQVKIQGTWVFSIAFADNTVRTLIKGAYVVDDEVPAYVG